MRSNRLTAFSDLLGFSLGFRALAFESSAFGQEFEVQCLGFSVVQRESSGPLGDSIEILRVRGLSGVDVVEGCCVVVARAECLGLKLAILIRPAQCTSPWDLVAPELSIRADLLALHRAGDPEVRSAAGQLDGDTAHRALPPRAPGRLRPGPLNVKGRSNR